MNPLDHLIHIGEWLARSKDALESILEDDDRADKAHKHLCDAQYLLKLLYDELEYAEWDGDEE